MASPNPYITRIRLGRKPDCCKWISCPRSKLKLALRSDPALATMMGYRKTDQSVSGATTTKEKNSQPLQFLLAKFLKDFIISCFAFSPILVRNTAYGDLNCFSVALRPQELKHITQSATIELRHLQLPLPVWLPSSSGCYPFHNSLSSSKGTTQNL